MFDFEEFEGDFLSDQIFVGETACQVTSGEEGTESFDEADGSTAIDAVAFGLKDSFGVDIDDVFDLSALF